MSVLNAEEKMLLDAASSWSESRRAPRQHGGRDGGIAHDLIRYEDMIDMGWTGILVPEAYGGSEFGLGGLAIVLEQLGRNLISSPLLPSALGAVSAVRLAGSAEQQAHWLPRLATGVTIGAVALEESGSRDPLRPTARVDRDGDGWLLNGEKRPVPHGMAAHVAIVSATASWEPDSVRLLIVPLDAPGVQRSMLRQIDGRDAASYRFQDVRLGDEHMLGADDAAAVLDEVLDRLRAGLAVEMLGMASKAFSTTLEYLKMRVQFGRTIGSFQALQHRAAEIYGELELARSAVEAAVVALETADSERRELVSLAKCLMGETLRLVTNEMIQMHGGIGMTDEHEAGLYLKRARVSDFTFGNTTFHRERYARLTGH